MSLLNRANSIDPFDSVHQFPVEQMVTKPSTPDRLFDHMSPVFIDVAKAIKHLGGRLQVEAIIGDYVDVAENIQHSLYTQKTSGQKNLQVGGSRPRLFHSLYDRIHLSNIPYVEMKCDLSFC
jgi:hypothetical protein